MPEVIGHTFPSMLIHLGIVELMKAAYPILYPETVNTLSAVKHIHSTLHETLPCMKLYPVRKKYSKSCENTIIVKFEDESSSDRTE